MITAKFSADFSSFYTAVQKADRELKSFESGAGAVGKALNRMVDNFSGRKLINDAVLMTEAVTEIGGATALTVKEQQKVNAAVTEAIKKYNALGDAAKQAIGPDAIANLEAMAKATAKIQPPKDASSAFSSLFGAFTLGNVAGNAISKITTEVAAFVDMGMRLGPVQTSFERLTKGVGINSGEMADAMRAGTRGMVSDLELFQSANKAMLLGIPVTAQSMGELSKSAVALGKAMGKDAASSVDDLITALGRSSPMILDNLGLTVDVTKANEEYAAKLNKTAIELTDAEKKLAFYDATVAAAEKATKQLGEQTKTLGDIMTTVWVAVANTSASTISTMNVGIGRLMSSWKNFFQAMAVIQAPSGGGGPAGMIASMIQAAAMLEAAERAGQQKKGDVYLAPEPSQVEMLEKYRKELAQLNAAVAKLTPAQREMIDANKTLAKSEEQLAKDVGTSEAVIKAYLAQVKDGAKDQKAHNKELDEAAKYAVALHKAHEKGVVALKAWNDALDDRIAKAIKGDFSIWDDQERAKLEAATASTITWIKVMRDGIPVVKGLGAEFKDLGAEGREHIEGVEQAAEKALKKIKEIKEIGGAAGFASGLAELGNIFGGAFGNVASGIGSISTGVRDMGKAFGVLQEPLAKVGDKFGAVVSGGVQAIGILMTVQNAVKGVLDQINYSAGRMAQGLQRAAGTLEDLNIELRNVGINTESLWNIKGQRQFDAAWARAEHLIDANNAAMERYGLTWKDFDSTAQDFVTKTGRDLVDFFDNFTKQGADAEKVLRGMSGDLNQLVIDAVQTGTKIPAAMRPMLEQLIRTGQLSEDAARALLGMADAGVPAFADVKEAAARYGIELAKLGPAINQLRIREAATQIAKDWQLLVDAGADVNGVLEGMQDEVQAVVTDALKMGLAIPESMKPVIQAMINAGLLTDQFGTKLTGLEGLSFEESLGKKLDELITKLDTLISRTIDFGNESVRQYDRARHAAEKTGEAVPRNPTPPADPGTMAGNRAAAAMTTGATATGAYSTSIFLDGEIIARSTAKRIPRIVGAMGV